MLLAIAVTSWHSQSYQLIIHDCRIRWQHDLTLLLHFFFVNDLSHNILMFVVNKMIEIPIKREEQRYVFSFQSTKHSTEHHVHGDYPLIYMTLLALLCYIFKPIKICISIITLGKQAKHHACKLAYHLGG